MKTMTMPEQPSFDPEAWVMVADRQLSNYYEFIGVPLFHEDLAEISKAIRIANRATQSYQQHSDPAVARRAAEIMYQLGRADATFSDPDRLRQHQMQILERLYDSWQQQNRPISHIGQFLWSMNIADPSYQCVCDALSSGDLIACQQSLDPLDRSLAEDQVDVEDWLDMQLREYEPETQNTPERPTSQNQLPARRSEVFNPEKRNRNFFVLVASGVVGPYSGVEVREAALAGIIRSDSSLSYSQSGPWTEASRAGLFDANGIPIDHPDGIAPPEYRYRIPGAEDDVFGPYRLHKLLQFASQGKVAVNAQLQNDWSPEWFPIQRVPILANYLEDLQAARRPEPATQSVVVPIVTDEKIRRRTALRSQSLSIQIAVASLAGFLVCVGVLLHWMFSSPNLETGESTDQSRTAPQGVAQWQGELKQIVAFQSESVHLLVETEDHQLIDAVASFDFLKHMHSFRSAFECDQPTRVLLKGIPVPADHSMKRLSPVATGVSFHSMCSTTDPSIQVSLNMSHRPSRLRTKEDVLLESSRTLEMPLALEGRVDQKDPDSRSFVLHWNRCTLRMSSSADFDLSTLQTGSVVAVHAELLRDSFGQISLIASRPVSPTPSGAGSSRRPVAAEPNWSINVLSTGKIHRFEEGPHVVESELGEFAIVSLELVAQNVRYDDSLEMGQLLAEWGQREPSYRDSIATMETIMLRARKPGIKYRLLDTSDFRLRLVDGTSLTPTMTNKVGGTCLTVETRDFQRGLSETLGTVRQKGRTITYLREGTSILLDLYFDIPLGTHNATLNVGQEPPIRISLDP